jgi:biofilm PGA synthesis N-glycosyltransferase PgaC
MIRAAVGIMVHNEVHNLPQLLARVCAERPTDVRLDPIVVVSSGSTDGSDEAVRRAADQDPRIVLLTEPSREGKARAVNRFLHALPSDVDRCVLMSGDVLPEAGAVEHLLTPLNRPTIGMTGAQVVPTNPRRGWTQGIVHLLWALHHQVASQRPKLGEMVAFRPDIGPIDPLTPVDEASIEATVTGRGLGLEYVPSARVFNRGPATLREIIAQRQRIWVGHMWLKRNTGYRVSTYRFRDLFRPILAWLIRRPHRFPMLLIVVTIEAWARIRGAMSLGLFGHVPTIWPVLPSAKAAIHPRR